MEDGKLAVFTAASHASQAGDGLLGFPQPNSESAPKSSPNQQHVFLLEVIDSPIDGINPDRDLFEATFAGTPGFPMEPNEELHLVLTNPKELDIAIRDGWPLATEVADAIRAGDYKVLYADDVGKQALVILQSERCRHEVGRG